MRLRDSFSTKAAPAKVHFRVLFLSLLVLVTTFGISTSAWSLQPSNNTEQQSSFSLSHKKFSKPELQVSSLSEPLKNIQDKLPKTHASARQRFLQRYGTGFDFHIDPRSGTPTNIRGHIPLIPGSGRDNHITHKGVSDAFEFAPE